VRKGIGASGIQTTVRPDQRFPMTVLAWRAPALSFRVSAGILLRSSIPGSCVGPGFSGGPVRRLDRLFTVTPGSRSGPQTALLL
jgi:hypothetical protein